MALALVACGERPRATLDPGWWAENRVKYAGFPAHKAMYVNLDSFYISWISGHASTSDAIAGAKAHCESNSVSRGDNPQRCVLAYLDDAQVTDVTSATGTAVASGGGDSGWSTQLQTQQMMLQSQQMTMPSYTPGFR